MYLELTGRKFWPATNGFVSRRDEASGGRLTRWRLINPIPQLDSGIAFHADGALSAAETKAKLEAVLRRANLYLIPVGMSYFQIQTMDASNLGIKGASVGVASPENRGNPGARIDGASAIP